MAVHSLEAVPAAAPARVRLDVAPIVRAGLCQVLAPHFREFVSVGARDGVLADVVVFDPDLAPGVASTARPVPRVALLRDDSEAGRARAHLLGADVVLTLKAEPAELVDALRRVGTGAPRVGTGRRLVGESGEPLSRREAEVLALICSGLSNVEIGEELYLGLNTVKTYVRTAYRKIGVSRRAQAVLWGIAHGLG